MDKQRQTDWRNRNAERVNVAGSAAEPRSCLRENAKEWKQVYCFNGCYMLVLFQLVHNIWSSLSGYSANQILRSKHGHIKPCFCRSRANMRQSQHIRHL